MVDGNTRPPVGAETHAEYQFLQLGFLHLHQHRGVLGIGFGAGVDADEGARVVAAVEQALLGIDHVALLVVGAARHAREAFDDDRVVALGSLDLHRAVLVDRAGIIVDTQVGAAGVRVDHGLAVGQFGSGKTLGLQSAQCQRLGVAPGVLHEGVALRQAPAVVDLAELRQGGGVVGDGTRKVQVHLLHGGARPGVDGDHHLGQRAARSGGAAGHMGLQFLPDLGREIALRAQQLADIGFGVGQQLTQFGIVQVEHLLVAFEFQMAIQQLAHLVIGGFDADVEGLALGNGGEGRIFAGWRGAIAVGCRAGLRQIGSRLRLGRAAGVAGCRLWSQFARRSHLGLRAGASAGQHGSRQQGQGPGEATAGRRRESQGTGQTGGG